MSLLYDAAAAWQALLGFRYEIICGKSKKLYKILLCFDASEFYHLAGFPHIRDIVFPVRFSQRKMMEKVLDGTITEEMITPSVSYEGMVKRKLTAIIHLEELLNRCAKVYQFNPRKLPFHTEIRATYLLVDAVTNVVFLFTDTADGGKTFFSRSTFVMDEHDFRANQSSMTVLQIKRTDLKTEDTEVLYCRPGFCE